MIKKVLITLVIIMLLPTLIITTGCALNKHCKVIKYIKGEER